MGLSSKLAAPDVDLRWSQGLLESGGLEIPKPTSQARNNQQQRQHWPPLKCPRCSSTNTKFCYYNNYSRTQPRYLCKACKRHWTEGGTLRNVPVGGARKNKRSKPPPAAATATASSTSAAASSAGAVYKMNTSNVSIPLDLAHQQGQQHKFPFLFGGDQYSSSSIFPEILRQVLLRSPPPTMPQLQLAPSDYTFTSLFSSDPNVAAKFTPVASPMDPIDGFSNNNSGSNNNPSFGISSSYYYTLPSAPDECVATINTCSTNQPVGTRQVGPVTALSTTTTSGLDHSSADYWCGWEDDMTGCS